jgi:hypothetical protein
MKNNPVDERFLSYYNAKRIPVRKEVWEHLERRLKHQRRKRLFFRVAAVAAGFFLITQIVTEEPFSNQNLQKVDVAAIKTTRPQRLTTTPITATPFSQGATKSFSLRKHETPLQINKQQYTQFYPKQALRTVSFSTYAQQLAQRHTLLTQAEQLLALVEQMLADEHLEQEALALRIQIENELAFEKTLKGNLKKLINALSNTPRVVLRE